MDSGFRRDDGWTGVVVVVESLVACATFPYLIPALMVRGCTLRMVSAWQPMQDVNACVHPVLKINLALAVTALARELVVWPVRILSVTWV